MGEYSRTACVGKVAYDSPALAEKVAKWRSRIEVRCCYKCRACGKWHIGSSIFNDNRRIRRYKLIKRELREVALIE